MPKIKKVIKVCGFILIFVFVLNAIQSILVTKFDSSNGTRTGFMEEQENSIDVLFLGSSNMFCTINPLLLYEETGICSFDFGSSSQSLNMSYMYLNEALKTQTPKVVCLEVLCTRANLNEELYEAGLRWGFTYFPNSINKIVRLYDQLNETIDAEYLSYVFPIIRYKDRWMEIEKDDFETLASGAYRKGYSMRAAVRTVSYEDKYWEELDWEIAESNVKTLNQIKGLCDKEQIELVLFKSPAPGLWKNVYSQRCNEWAKENEVPFIDYNSMLGELGIDLELHFRDTGHLNDQGATLTTKHMAEYLAANYELEDCRNGEQNSWDRACAEWHRREKNNKLANATNLETFLQNLEMTDYTISFSMVGEVDEIQKNKLLTKFNIQANTSVESGVIVNGESVVLNERGIAYSWHDAFDGQDYAIEGAPNIDEDNQVTYIASFYVNGENCSVVSRGINVVVYDNQLKEFVCCIGFDADTEYTMSKFNVGMLDKW